MTDSFEVPLFFDPLKGTQSQGFESVRQKAGTPPRVKHPKGNTALSNRTRARQLVVKDLVALREASGKALKPLATTRTFNAHEVR
jgi:hypothetical protein